MKPPSEAKIPVSPCRKCAKDSFYRENYQCSPMYDGIQDEQTCEIAPPSTSLSYNTVNGCSAVTLICPAGSSYYVNSKIFDNQPDPKQVYTEEIFKVSVKYFHADAVGLRLRIFTESSTGECTKAYLSVASANSPTSDLGIFCRDGVWKYLDIENKYYNVPVQSVMCGKPK
ncbi:hypothetical protein PRIPAC_81703 [Pristionchus pacificus]|uniref:Uncharacterized protein n=1 Tax=Pristionchus pacificus TaxID=54126 RepID=A0A2A6BHX3_PRIPA|nr:hypothetical protein PRIPAC_81703 [Pristionchus pacificus]|eukprot:PDM65492.1 hypothetical protein PRIPAC_52434 [Pristionchus pacificus]